MIRICLIAVFVLAAGNRPTRGADPLPEAWKSRNTRISSVQLKWTRITELVTDSDGKLLEPPTSRTSEGSFILDRNGNQQWRQEWDSMGLLQDGLRTSRLIAVFDKSGEPYLTDFGLAKKLGANEMAHTFCEFS